MNSITVAVGAPLYLLNGLVHTQIDAQYPTEKKQETISYTLESRRLQHDQDSI